jgi:predicted lipoprotein with Yx(FWY)xxD motif
MKSELAILAAAFVLGTSVPAFADMASAKNGILVNSAGMTLYTFDNDKDGVSSCYEECAKNWPPLLADAGAKAEGDMTLADRKDGSRQWAFKGKPLYLWAKDAKPGDMTGDNVKNVWHVAK